MAVLGVAVLALIGLGGSVFGGQVAQPPTPSEPSPSVSASIADDANPAVPVGERRGPFRVLRVVDGATFLVEEEPGRTTTVHLLGVDAPVLSDVGLQTNCLASAATAALRSMLEGRTVRLQTDLGQGDVDRQGRRLAYVFVDNTLINQTLLQGGYAVEYAERRPYRYEARFRNAEQSAREEGLGVWSPGSCAAGAS